MVIYIFFELGKDSFFFWRFCFHLFILLCRNFCNLFLICSITGCATVVTATAVTAATVVVTNTSAGGIGIGGKGGKFNVGGLGSKFVVRDTSFDLFGVFCNSESHGTIQTLKGGTSGSPAGTLTYISFQRNDGDTRGSITNSGNIQLSVNTSSEYRL